MENKLQKLKRFNLIMGALHFVQGIAMIFLATSVIQKIGQFQPTITQNFLKYDVEAQGLVTASKALFDLPFGILVASFLLISALAHGIVYMMSDKYLADFVVVVHIFPVHSDR